MFLETAVYFIAALIIDLLGLLLLGISGIAGYAAYQAYERLPQEAKNGSPLQTFMTQQQLQVSISACVVALMLFIICMVAHAVIDTARNTRKILNRLESIERARTD